MKTLCFNTAFASPMKLTELLFVGCFVIGVTESPIAVTHLRGCQGRTSPLGPNSFMQDSAKNLQNNRLAHILRELASLSYPREILDLVLKTKVPAAPLKGRMVSSKIQEKNRYYTFIKLVVMHA